MAEEASVSDTQALLHSMLQRLKLQTRAESERTHTPGRVYPAPIQQNGWTEPSRTPKVQYHGPTDARHHEDTRLEPLADLNTTNLSSAGQVSPKFSTGLSPTDPPPQSRWYLKRHAQPAEKPPFSWPDHPETPSWPWRKKPVQKTLSNNSNISSTPSIDSLMPPSPTLSSRSSNHGGEPGQKELTQRTRGRLQSPEEDNHQESVMTESCTSTGPVQTLLTATSRAAPLTLIPPGGSPPNPLSEPFFSPGSFNLMEEIFTGQEWSRFFLSGSISQSGARLVDRDDVMETPSSISQSQHSEANVPALWNHRASRSQTNSEGQNMDTTDPAHNALITSVLPTAPVPPGQHGSRHPENMDMSFGPSENTEPCHQSTPIQGGPEGPPHHQSCDFRVDHAPTKSSHEEIPSVLEPPHVQRMDGPSLRRLLSLSRKRSYSSERERPRETAGAHQWRRCSPLEYLASSLSSSSSSSSLMDSMSECSESSGSSEMLVKKRRMENTRRVRFAQEVTILPDPEDQDEPQDHDEPQDDILELRDTYEDSLEEPPPPPPPATPRLSVPRWIEALRNKTKKKPKLPQIRSSRFRIRKKASFV